MKKSLTSYIIEALHDEEESHESSHRSAYTGNAEDSMDKQKALLKKEEKKKLEDEKDMLLVTLGDLI